MTRTSSNRNDLVLADGEQLAATYLDDKPVYFVVAADATDYEVGLAAFEVRHGRQPTPEELALLGMIERNHHARRDQ